jgi:hypothetical protein
MAGDKFLWLGVSSHLTQIGRQLFLASWNFKIVSTRLAVHPVSLARALMMKSPGIPCSW